MHCGNFRGCFDADFLLELQRVEEEPVFLDGVYKWRTPDHIDGRARAGEQTSKISADGARTDDGNPGPRPRFGHGVITLRSEEHTSELQLHVNLVCRLLLEKR